MTKYVRLDSVQGILNDQLRFFKRTAREYREMHAYEAAERVEAKAETAYSTLFQIESLERIEVEDE